MSDRDVTLYHAHKVYTAADLKREKDALREAIAKMLEAAGCRCYEKIIGTELRVRAGQDAFDKEYLGQHPYVWIEDVRHGPWCPRSFADRIRSGEIG